MRSSSRGMVRTGLILVAVSIVVLLPLLYEPWMLRRAQSRYEVEPLSALSAAIGGHQITLTDAVDAGSGETLAPIRTTVDGKDWSTPWPVRVRPEYENVNRYWFFAALARWHDRATGERRLVSVQRNSPVSRDDLQFRLLFVHENGAVTEERFGYADRATPPYRVLLGNSVALLSFRFAFAYGLPGFVFPLVFPFGTFVLGVLLLGAGAVAAWV